MSKKTGLILGLVGIILAGFAYLFLNSEDQTKTPNTSAVESSPTNNSTPSAVGTEGKYVTYSENVIAQTPGTKVLFFHAPWCPQCRDLEASIKAGTIPPGVTIIKVDYDSMRDLRKKYGVTIQTSLVRVSDSGELEKKYVAYDEPNLESLKRNIL